MRCGRIGRILGYRQPCLSLHFPLALLLALSNAAPAAAWSPPPGAATPAPATTATSAPVTIAPAPTAEKSCCLCHWDDGTDCASLPDEQSCVAKSDCEWNSAGWFTAAGTCGSQFKRQCDEWLSAQPDCDEARSLPVMSDPGPWHGGMAGCTTFWYDYEGHSSPGRCAQFFSIIQVCMSNQAPTCQGFFSNTGCQTFDSIADAMDLADVLVAYLGGEQCATITANQCSSWRSDPVGTCSTGFQITVTPNGACGKPAIACAWGQRCRGEARGESALCGTGAGVGRQTCCCAGDGSDGAPATADDAGCTWENVVRCPVPGAPRPKPKP